MDESKKKNILIGGLLAIVLVMAVGYAAFATTLTINGTATITSNWNVYIESITAGTPTGGALDVPYDSSTATDGTHKVSDTVAQFKTTLVSPGDSLTYTVVVKNSGTIPAALQSIAWADPSVATGDASSPIEYSYEWASGEDGNVAANNDTATLYVTVTYKSIANQGDPTTKTKAATLTLNYVQDTSS